MAVFGWLRKEPKHLVDQRRRMSEALVDYPVYEPPHRQGPHGPRHLSDQEAREFWARGKENFSHFMERRKERLDALRTFLARFDVAMDLEQAGLAAVSAWLPGNCGTLVSDLGKEETVQIFFRYLAPWVGDLRGLNVIFDLGIFFGECVIFRNPRLHWIDRQGLSDGGHAAGTAYHIDGFKRRRDWLDPMCSMLYLCGDDERDFKDMNARPGASAYQLGPRVSAERLVGTVRDLSTR
jgi:hypothetical protein